MARLGLERVDFLAMIRQGLPHVRVSARKYRVFWPDAEKWMRRRARAEARKRAKAAHEQPPDNQAARPRRRSRVARRRIGTAVVHTPSGAVLGDPRFKELQLRT